MSTDLLKAYLEHCETPSDINEHLPVLKKYAQECDSVMEIGIRTMVSTWSCLYGLANNNRSSNKIYIGVDLEYPPTDKYELARKVSRENNIHFNFYKNNDMNITFNGPVDMLFIDSLHIYCHLTYELETFCPYVNKYICFHDIDYPWGFMDEPYTGGYDHYPSWIDKNKRGLLQAVIDFLERHPEWTFLEHRKNSHGFGVLKRISTTLLKE